MAAYQDVVAEFGLNQRILIVVTDSASNMLKAFKAGFPTEQELAEEACGVEPEVSVPTFSYLVWWCAHLHMYFFSKLLITSPAQVPSKF